MRVICPSAYIQLSPTIVDAQSAALDEGCFCELLDWPVSALDWPCQSINACCSCGGSGGWVGHIGEPQCGETQFGETSFWRESHRIEINLARISPNSSFQFYRVFSSFFSIWRIWRSGEEVQGTSSGAAEVPWTSSRTLLGTGNWGEVGRGRDTMNAKNYIQVDVGGGVGLGGDSTNSKKSLFSEYDL